MIAKVGTEVPDLSRFQTRREGAWEKGGVLLPVVHRRTQEALYREDYYLKEKTPEERVGVAEVIVSKNRNGPTGEVSLRFLAELTRFENLTH